MKKKKNLDTRFIHSFIEKVMSKSIGLGKKKKSHKSGNLEGQNEIRRIWKFDIPSVETDEGEKRSRVERQS